MSVYERDPNTGNLNLVAGNIVYEDEDSIIATLNRTCGNNDGNTLTTNANIDSIDKTSKYYINSANCGGPEAAWGLVETDVSDAGNIIQRWYGLASSTAYFRNRLSGTWTSWIPLSTPFKLGIDSSGNYGYIKAGADTVTPFKTTFGNIVSSFQVNNAGYYAASYTVSNNVNAVFVIVGASGTSKDVPLDHRSLLFCNNSGGSKTMPINGYTGAYSGLSIRGWLITGLVNGNTITYGRSNYTNSCQGYIIRI